MCANLIEKERWSKLVPILRSYLTPYWRVDINAIASKLLAMRLLPLYARMESLSRDTSSAIVEMSNMASATRRDLTELRKLLEEKGVIDKYEGYIRIRKEGEDPE